jgi:hypothetical protein
MKYQRNEENHDRREPIPERRDIEHRLVVIGARHDVRWQQWSHWGGKDRNGIRQGIKEDGRQTHFACHAPLGSNSILRIDIRLKRGDFAKLHGNGRILQLSLSTNL